LTDQEAFIRSATALGASPLVPEIVLHLASELTPLWLATEGFLEREGVSPPFWAFAWPGAQALARTLLDNPASVAGRRVLDFAAGCGLAGLAAVWAGAASVQASEIDPLAVAAIRLNAAANGLALDAVCEDVVGQACRWDLILCGDVCYEAPMTRHILPWLEHMQEAGALVWIADPGRAYLPREKLHEFARFEVPTSLELEDRPSRTTTLYTLERTP
jgi:predicted nicotinamide N-methyase